MKMFNPLFFIALGLFGVYTIEFGVVGILPVIIERYSVSASEAGYPIPLPGSERRTENSWLSCANPRCGSISWPPP
ncbi:hypothetical protein [Pseudomonas sp. PB3P13]